MAPPPIPVGFTVGASPSGDLGAALLGRTLLYWWTDNGWQRGTVARLCPRGAFSQLVACARQTSALRGTADRLLDALSYSSLAGHCSRGGSGPWARPPIRPPV